MKLCFFLTLLTIAKGNLVLDFEGDEDSIAELKVDLQIPVNESTFCINFFYKRYGLILLFRKPGLSLSIDLLRDLAYWRFDRNPRYAFDLHGLISAHEWITFCVANDQTTTQLYGKGKLIGNLTRTNHYYPDQEFIPIPSFFFGIYSWVPQKDVKITNFKVWSSKLSNEELEIITRDPCKIFNHDESSMVFDWNKVDQGSFISENAPYKIDKTKLEDLCVISVIEYFKDKMTFESADHWCDVLGGKLFYPKKQRDFDQLQNLTIDGDPWLPIVFEDGNWVNFYTKESVGYLNWAENEPNGKASEPCVQFRNNDFTYNDIPCSHQYTVLCHFHSSKEFQFKGIEVNAMDTKYIIDYVATTPEQGLVFQGLYNGQVLKFNPYSKMWAVQESRENETKIASSKVETSPVGLQQWTISRSNETMKLKFSRCKGSQFTCYNGACIPLSMKCNQMVDCSDFSDEKNCQLLSFNPDTYESIHPPIQKERVQVTVGMNLESIYHIDEMNMKFNSKLEISMTWKDSRITFYDLMNHGNFLNSDQSGLIWIPQLVFVNSEDSDTDSLSTKSGQVQEISVLKEGLGTPFENTYEEGLTYAGSENSLKLTALHIKQFQCDYQLKAYPFDTQRCFIKLRLPKIGTNHMTLMPGEVQISPNISIAQFEIQDIHLRTNGNSSIECYFDLKRTVANYHIYATFSPTIFICIMSLLSLFVNEEHFEATIMVSLTCMLVLYTLLQSIMAGMPVTSYIKLLDIWLAFNLSMPFIVFVTIIVWELLKERKIHPLHNMTPPPEVEKKTSREKCKIAMQITLPLISTAFVSGYTFIAIQLYLRK